MKYSALIRILFALQILMCAFLWVFSIFHYSSLPEIIPQHFGLDGKPDRFGHKNMLFSLPVIGTAMFFLLRYLAKNPHSPGLNVSEKIKANPFLTQVFVGSVSVCVLGIFSLILFEEIQIIKHYRNALSNGVMFLVGGMLIYVLIFNFYHRKK